MRRRFVIHEHEARAHHFDFRLELDGVLKSWAVPKNIPETPCEKRLAIQVPDHPLEYRDFEGQIPAGTYGAGTVRIWDRGYYDLQEWSNDKIVVHLHGEHATGNYTLVPFPGSGEGHWLLIKARD